MSATTWLVMAIIGFSLAGIALIAAVFIFIKLNIPSVIGDLSGKTVAREIKAMREANAAGEGKKISAGALDFEKGKSDKVGGKKLDTEGLKIAHASKRLDKTGGIAAKEKEAEQFARNVESRKPLTAEDNETELLTDNGTEMLTDNATEVLTDNATEILADNATEILVDNATEVLVQEEMVANDGTTVLSNTEQLEQQSEEPVKFEIVYDEVIIHTDEII